MTTVIQTLVRSLIAVRTALKSCGQSGGKVAAAINPIRGADKVSLADYRAALAPAARRRTPCLCTNPDKVMLTASGNAPGAGRIAEIYEELGGAVTWVGKPFPEIYRAAAELARIGHSSSPGMCCSWVVSMDSARPSK